MASKQPVRHALLLLALLGVSFRAWSGEPYTPSPFEIPQGAYSAEFVEDRNHVTVMRWSGNYDKKLPTGEANAAARAIVAREFFRTHPDNYDFLVVFTGFEFDTGDATAFHIPVRNDIQGIGIPNFDNSTLYGSNGKLQSYIDMAAMNRYNFNPFSPDFEKVLGVMSHEVLHRWASHSDIPDLRGRDNAHWNFFMDTAASVEYGHQWRDNGNGSFTAEAARLFYSPLDLYLMGMYTPEQVPPFYVIHPAGSEFSPSSLPRPGVTVNGTRQNYTINDVIAAQGERVPGAADAQKVFRYGFIYLIDSSAQVDNVDITHLNTLRDAYHERFPILTGGQGIAQIYPEEKLEGEIGEGDVISDPGELNAELDLESGLAWLRSQQVVDTAAWQDKGATRLRDTVEAYVTLSTLDASFTRGNVAINWLHQQLMENTPLDDHNTDSIARAANLMPDAELVTRLLQRQNSDGGWGLKPGLHSSVLDTALAVQALNKRKASATVIQQGVSYLLQQQNTDGSWSTVSKSRGSISVTAQVLLALKGNSSASTAINSAMTWLKQQGHADGGFGNEAGNSSVHETAQVVLTFLALEKLADIPYAESVKYIGARQHESGSWNGSVYTTALALRVLQSVNLPNLTAVSLVAETQSLTQNIMDGMQVPLTVVIKNNSSLIVEPTTVQFYSGNPAVAGSVPFSEAGINRLAPYAAVTVTGYWDTFDQAGQKTIYAVVDGARAIIESSESDNAASLSLEVKPAPAGVELEASDAAIVATPSRPASLPVEVAISAVIRNLGMTDASAVTVQLWRGDPQQDGVLIDTQVLVIPNRASVAANFVVPHDTAGTVTYTVVADPDRQYAEANENNNLARVQVITEDAIDLDVQVEDVSLLPDPAVLNEDAVFTVSLRNKGTLTTPNTPVVFSIVSESGPQILQTLSVILNPGETRNYEVVWRPASEGSFNFLVRIDESNLVAETDETNNTVSVPVSVSSEQGQNAIISYKDIVLIPSPAQEGQSLAIEFNARNSGTVAIDSLPVSIYDGDPAAGGIFIAGTAVSSLAPGASIPVQVVWPAIAGSGEKTIYIVLDPDNAIEEIKEDDNKAFAKLMVVSLPDLTVSESSIQINPAFPTPEDNVAITVTVNNLGLQIASHVPVLVYRGDPASGGTLLHTESLTVASAASTAFVVNHIFGEQGGGDLYVVIDPEDLVPEIRDDNNTAQRSFSIQNGNFTVSQRYISPDGNGVQDSSQYIFKLENAQVVTPVVLDSRKRVVRTFATTAAITSGSVTWNGRNDSGGIVGDGEYRLALKTSAGLYVGESLVTVDTNRSPLIDAMGTEFELNRNLSCQIGKTKGIEGPYYYRDTDDTLPPVYNANNDQMYFVTHFTPYYDDEGNRVTTGDGVLYPSGIYRANSDGTQPSLLVGDMEANGVFGISSVTDIYPTADGKYLFINGEMGLYRYEFSSGELSYAGHFDWGNVKIIFANENMVVGTNHWGAWKIDLALNGERHEFWEPNEDWIHADINPQGTYLLISSGWRDVLRLFNVITGESIDVGDWPLGFKWSPTGDVFAVLDNEDGVLGARLVNTQGEAVQEFNTHDLAYAGNGRDRLPLVWNPDGSEFVFANAGSQPDGCGEGGCEELVDMSTFNATDAQGLYLVALADSSVNQISHFVVIEGGNPGPVLDIMSVSSAASTSEPVCDAYTTNEAGVRFASTGLPCIPWSINNGGYQSPWGYFAQTLNWVPSSRTLLLAPVSNPEQGSTGANEWIGVAIDLDQPLESSRNLFMDDIHLANGATDFSSAGRFFEYMSTDRCTEDGASALYSFGQTQSLLNQVTDLRALRSGRFGGIKLSGTATDKNFDLYELHYAYSNAPTVWYPVVPPADTMVINDLFTTWVPPSIGTYFVRLTTKDLAGNIRQAIQRVTFSDQPSITNLVRSPQYFSPNGDSILDSTTLSFKVLESVNLDLNIYDANDVLVRSYSRSYDESAVNADHAIIWNGLNDAGLPLPDGTYRMVLQDYEFFVTLDKTPPSLTEHNGELFYPQDRNTGQPCTNPAITPELDCLVGMNQSLGARVQDAVYLDAFVMESLTPGATSWNTWRMVDNGTNSRELDSVIALDDLAQKQFRFRATDKAGNETILNASMDLKRPKLHLLSAGDAQAGLEALHYEFVGHPSYGNYLPTVAAADLFGILLAETIPADIASVEIQYREVTDVEPYTPVSDTGEYLSLVQTLYSNFGGYLQLALDYKNSPMDPEKHYQLRVRLIDTQGEIYLSDSFVLIPDAIQMAVEQITAYEFAKQFRISQPEAFSALEPRSLKPRPRLGVAQIAPVAVDDIARVVISIQSVEDPLNPGRKLDNRYLTFTEFQHIIPDLRASDLDTVWNSLGGTFLFDTTSLMDCARYTVIAKFEFANPLRQAVDTEGMIDTSCLEIKRSVEPVLSEVCNGETPAQIAISLEGKGSLVSAAGEQLSLVTLSIPEGVVSDHEEVIYNQNSSPGDIPVVQGTYFLDITRYPEGDLPLVARSIAVNGEVKELEFTVPIVKQPASIDLLYPLQGSRICASHFKDPADPARQIRGVEVAADIRSAGVDLAYNIISQKQPGLPGETAATSNYARYCTSMVPETLGEIRQDDALLDNVRAIGQQEKCRAGENSGFLIEGERYYSNDMAQVVRPKFNALKNEIESTGTVAIPVKLSGNVPYQLEVEAYNWGGYKQCQTITYEVDAEITGLVTTIEDGLSVYHQPYRKSYLFVSPNGDGKFDTIKLNTSLEENATATLEVFSTTASIDGSGRVSVDDHLLSAQPFTDLAYGSGQNGFEWDGTDDAGNVLGDGIYHLVLKIKDACGNLEQQDFYVGIDTTPPVAVITYPANNDNVGLVIQPRGSVGDLHGVQYLLSVSAPGDAASTVIGQGGTKTNAILGSWNTFGQTGTHELILLATDKLGNEKETRVSFLLPERVNLISSHTTTNYFVSPNGDGRLETLSIRTKFDQDVTASFDIVRGGQVIRSLATNQLYAEGYVSLAWDGKQSDNTLAPDGEYQVRVTAAGAGNLQTEVVDFEVDTRAPVFDIDNLVDGFIELRGSNLIPGNVDDKNFGNYRIRIVEGPALVGAILAESDERVNGLLAELVLDDLLEGNYRLSFEAEDLAENRVVVTANLIHDITPPLITIAHPEAGTPFNLASSPISIQGAIEEANPKHYQVTVASEQDPEQQSVIAGGVFPSAGKLADWNLSGLADGNYLITVKAEDKAGLTSSKTLLLVVDNTAPVAEITTPEREGYLVKLDPVLGSANDEHFLQYELAMAVGHVGSGGSFSNQIVSDVPVTTSVLLDWAQLPADGTYTFRLKAKDKAGNSSTTYHPFVIDTTPPAKPVMIAATATPGTSDVTVIWVPNIETDLAGYDLYRNGSKVNDALLTTTTYLDAGLPEGRYEYTVKAIDKAGWVSVPSEPVAVIVDTTPPLVSISRPLNNTLVSGLVDIQGTAFSETDFKDYRILVGTDENNLQLIKESVLSVRGGELAQWNTLGYPEGQVYLIRLTAEDLTGNVATTTVQVTIDNTPPAAPIQLVATVTEDDVGLDWSHAQAEPDFLGYLLFRDNRLVNAPLNIAGDLRAYAIPNRHYDDADRPDGAYSYVVYAIDTAGNISDPSNEEVVTIDLNRPPQAVITSVKNGQKFEAALYLQAVSDDQDVASIDFEYRAVGASVWTVIARDASEPYTHQWDTTALPYGDYELRAIATDTKQLVDPTPQVLSITKQDLVAPAAVVDLEVSVNGTAGTLVWQANSDEDLAGYHVYRTQDGCSWCLEQLTAEPIIGTTFVDNITYDVHYLYTVKAVDVAGNLSASSNEALGVYFGVNLNPLVSFGTTESISVEGYLQEPGEITLSVIAPDTTISTYTINSGGNSTFVFEAVNLPVDGNYRMTATAKHASGNFISRVSNEITTLKASYPSKPTGVTAVYDQPNNEIDVRWNSNPASENVIVYRAFRDGLPLNPQALIVPQAAFANSGTTASINGMLPGNAGMWVASTASSAPIEPDFGETWTTPAVVHSIELDWNNSARLATSYHIYARMRDGSYQYIESVYPGVVLNQVIILSQPVMATGIRLDINGYVTARRFELLEMRVKGERLYPEGVFFSDKPGEGYHDYTISAINQYWLEGPKSDPATAGYGDITPPDPVTLQAGVNGADVTLEWTAAVGATQYRLYRDGILIYTGPDINYLDASLVNGTYQYVVKAVDAARNASADSNTAEAVVAIALFSPPSIQAEADNDNRLIGVYWQPAEDELPAMYHLYRSTQADSGYSLHASQRDTYFEDAAIELNTDYYYFVVALDLYGNQSLPSSVASAKVVDETVIVPVAPVITSPTVAGMPYASPVPQVDIAGFAMPGSTVSLKQDGALTDRTTQATEVAEAHQAQYAANIDTATGYMSTVAVSKSGRLAGIWYLNQDDDSKDILFLREGIWQRAFLSADLNGGSYDGAFWLDDDRIAISYYTGHLTILNTDGQVLTEIDLGYLNADEIYPFAYDTTIDTLYVNTWSSQTQQAKIIAVAVSSLAVTDIAESTGLSGAGISPDGNRLVYNDYASGQQEIKVLDLESGLTTSLVMENGYVFTDGSGQATSGDGKLLFVMDWTAGGIRYFDINQALLSDVVIAGYPGNFAWMGSRSILFHNYSRGSIDEYNASTGTLTARVLLSDLAEPFMYMAGASNNVIYGAFWDSNDLYQITQITPEGYFRFDEVNLNQGTNTFSVVSLLAPDNIERESESIDIQYELDVRADLSGRLAAYPKLPLVNSASSLTATVSNLGYFVSGTALVSVTERAPDGSVRQLDVRTVAAIASGDGITYTLPWKPEQSGVYQLTIFADAERQVSETDEFNNQMTIQVQVVAVAEPLLNLRVNPSATADNHFGANELLEGQVIVTNAGEVFNGRLDIEILDSNQYLVRELSKTPVVNLAYGASQSVDINWDTALTYPGAYTVRAILYNSAGQELQTDNYGIVIVGDIDLTATLSADAPSYRVGSQVLLLSTLTNHSDNINFVDGEATITVVDADAIQLMTETVLLGELIPGESTQLQTRWNTGTAIPGTYYASIHVERDGIELALASDTFELLPGIVQLEGSLDVDNPRVSIGSSVHADYQISNKGNTAVSLVDITLHLQTASGARAQLTTEVTDLAANETRRLEADFGTAQNLPGNYQLIMEATLDVNGERLKIELDRLPLMLFDATSPVVSILVPANGAIINSRKVSGDIHALDNDGVATVEAQFNVGGWITVPFSMQSVGHFTLALDHLSDGNHIVSAQATDNLGYGSNAVQTAFIVDNTPPVITIGNVANDGIYAAGIDADVNVTDLHLIGNVITLNGLPYISGTPIDADGQYRLSVTGTDAAGNTAVNKVTFAVDATPPLIVVTGLVDGAIYHAPVAAAITVTDAQLAASEILLDGVPYSSGTVIAGNGTHLLSVQASDLVGNQSEMTIQFTINQVPPTVAITGVAEGGLYNHSVQPVITVTSSLQTELVATLNGAAYTPGTAIASEGLYQLVVTATDTNDETGTASVNFELDLTAPQIIIDGVQSGATYNTPVTAIISVTDKQLETTTVLLDGAPYVSGTEIRGNGAHTLSVTANDLAGNDSSASVSFTIQQIAPVVVITGVAEGGLYNHSVQPVITVTSSLQTELVATLNGAAYIPGALIAAEGSYQLVATATDTNDETGTASVNFELDLTAPAISVEGIVDGIVYSTAVSPRVSITDKHLSNSTLLLDGAPFVSGSTVSSVGIHTLDISASDSAGNQANQSINFTIKAPVSLLSGNVTTSAPQVGQGEYIQCTYTISNTSNSLSVIARIEQRLVRLDTQAPGGEVLVNSSSLVKTLLPMQSDTAIESIETLSLSPGDYVCQQFAAIAPDTLALGAASFRVVETATEIDVSYTLGNKGRVLVLLDASANTNGEAAYLANLLKSESWSYHFVFSPGEFMTAMDTGQYMVYAVFSNDQTLPISIQASLAVEVNSGKGLLMAGAIDTCDIALESLFGIDITDDDKYGDSIIFPDGSLGDDWIENRITQEVNFAITAKEAIVLAYVAEDDDNGFGNDYAHGRGHHEHGQGHGYGHCKGKGYGHDDDCGGDNERPAVTANQYGNGISIFAGFDALATAQASTSLDNTTATLILYALEQVQPYPIQLSAANAVPVILNVSNHGDATQLRLMVANTSNARVVAGDGWTSLDENGLSDWQYNGLLGKQGSLSTTLYVQLLDNNPVSLPLSAATSLDGQQWLEHGITPILITPVVPESAPAQPPLPEKTCDCADGDRHTNGSGFEEGRGHEEHGIGHGYGHCKENDDRDHDDRDHDDRDHDDRDHDDRDHDDRDHDDNGKEKGNHR